MERATINTRSILLSYFHISVHDFFSKIKGREKKVAKIESYPHCVILEINVVE